jgi:arsenate reductase (thioredoxin)
MAEGFARAYGQEVLTAQSAGLAPAIALAPLSHHVMLEKNIDLGDYYPKQFDQMAGAVDLIVNMSSHELPARPGTQVETWTVRDPIGESEDVFRQVRDEIEQRVLELIERLRLHKPMASEAVSQVDTPRRSTRQ